MRAVYARTAPGGPSRIPSAMLNFIARRIASGVLLLVVISLLSYVLLSIPGTDVGRQLLGQGTDQAAVDAKNAALGLDRPVLRQYADWLVHAVRGDLGTSWFTSEDVTQAVLGRLPVTLSLMIGVTLVTTVVSFLLGVLAGVRRGAVDRFVQVLGVVGYALPGFLVTLVLVLVFAVRLNWFPAIGHLRRAGLRTRPDDTAGRARPAAGHPGRDRDGVSLRDARPVRGALHEPPGGGDPPRGDRGDG